MALAIDVAGGEEGRRCAVDGDAALVGKVGHGLELIDGGIEAAVGNAGVAANIANTVAREVLEVGLVGGGALAAQFHARRWSGSGARGLGCGGECRNGGRGGDELSAIHRKPVYNGGFSGDGGCRLYLCDTYRGGTGSRIGVVTRPTFGRGRSLRSLEATLRHPPY